MKQLKQIVRLIYDENRWSWQSLFNPIIQCCAVDWLSASSPMSIVEAYLCDLTWWPRLLAAYSTWLTGSDLEFPFLTLPSRFLTLAFPHFPLFPEIRHLCYMPHILDRFVVCHFSMAPEVKEKKEPEIIWHYSRALSTCGYANFYLLLFFDLRARAKWQPYVH